MSVGRRTQTVESDETSTRTTARVPMGSDTDRALSSISLFVTCQPYVTDPSTQLAARRRDPTRVICARAGCLTDADFAIGRKQRRCRRRRWRVPLQDVLGATRNERRSLGRLWPCPARQYSKRPTPPTRGVSESPPHPRKVMDLETARTALSLAAVDELLEGGWGLASLAGSRGLTSSFEYCYLHREPARRSWRR
jgi:hypothetical protein